MRKRSFATWTLPLWCALALAASPERHAARDVSPFDPTPWLEDLAQVREAVATKYANIEWVVFSRELNLTVLFDETAQRIRLATTAAEARAAFDRLARRFDDGHVQFRWPQGQPHSQAPQGRCAALGFDARMFGTPIAALLPGYEPLSSAPASEFPSGLITVQGRRIGVLKIGIFTPQGVPQLCERALADLRIGPAAACDDACAERITHWAADRMTRDLEAQILALQGAGAEVLLVDIAQNGGGTEWAEAAARMLTTVRLHSERLGFVRGEHWAQALGDQAVLEAAARGAQEEDRALLTQLVQQTAAARLEAQSVCDSAPLWSGQPLKCRWLGQGLYATGLLSAADPARLRGKAWAARVFTPAQFNYREGVWRGPLVLLVDGGTGSAAAEFAAELQDNHAATLIGAPAAGGCGHTNGGTPTHLRNSGAVLELPDCARFRADGSNEMDGIVPDVLVGLREADGPHREALKVSQKLAEAVALAAKR